ncbi:Uncharacterised protein [Vibrio cholerae]|uniref:Uncharacterized protein n=1 Tax=Vibrio cholerae TaxID=666 RepID=A0A655XSJ5_VIBCL|nr:Uncharacterised protein [Vibrio cholerae]CSC22616.1 Uncharacterised protein [Vibrio cholerae]CSC55930.1 Uncharacterised protein [Vibrio cholerae]CSC55991.1 Uncharacterised protein [Vibrio cholerae]CSC58834.1 Uncharacterised protein [Vibrio cholerae]
MQASQFGADLLIRWADISFDVRLPIFLINPLAKGFRMRVTVSAENFIQILIASGSITIVVVTDFILLVVVLMVIFCWPELFKLNQLGFEWLFEYAELVNLHHKTFSHFKLLGVVVENRRAILFTSIHKRALVIGWVDVSEEVI